MTVRIRGRSCNKQGLRVENYSQQRLVPVINMPTSMISKAMEQMTHVPTVLGVKVRVRLRGMAFRQSSQQFRPVIPDDPNV